MVRRGMLYAYATQRKGAVAVRICFLSTGTFTHIGTYLEHFRRAGHDVHFLALSPSPPRSVPTHDLALWGDYSLGRGKWKYPLSMPRARWLVRRLRPDVVHAHYATSGGLAGLVCGHRATVVTVHGTDLTQRMDSHVWRRLLKAVFDHAARVNTVSAELTSLSLRLGVPPEKISEFTPGIDTARYQAQPRTVDSERGLRLICTRRLEPIYDHRTVIEALALIKRRGVAFKATFVGDGVLRRELRKLATRLGLTDELSFLGQASADEMPALLAAHDVYLSASRTDGTSLSLLEAMASGLFPIVSQISANQGWLQDGVGGFLHRVADPAHLAERVWELSRRPQLMSPAAKINRALVLEAGDRAANMKKLEGLYEEVVRRHSV